MDKRGAILIIIVEGYFIVIYFLASFLLCCRFSCLLYFLRNKFILVLGDGIVGSTEAPPKAFLLFFLFSDWLKLNHLKSRMECGFSDIFSRHNCSTVAETIGVTNYAASFGAKKCSENHI